MLELQNLQKKYGAGWVINIPLYTLEGGIYWLKGANGSGKTTLLKMVAGLLPFDGEIRLHHISLTKNGVAYRQQISWAEAEPLYPPFISGSNLVCLYENIKKASKKETDNLIDHLEMHSYIHQPIGTYSAGMIKKLSLLLAFMGTPSFIILDEPLIMLDADAVKLLADLILKKNTINGCSFLMSSHQDLQEDIARVGKVITIQNTTITTA